MKKGEKTKKKILQAYYAILATQEEDVSVQDICNNLDIYRSTFYNYFSNISELEEDIYQSLFGSGVESIEFAGQDLFDPEALCRLILNIATHYEGNREQVLLILSSARSHRLRQMMEENIRIKLKACFRFDANLDTSFLLDFLTAGIMASFTRWLEFRETTKQEFANLVAKTLNSAVRSLGN